MLRVSKLTDYATVVMTTLAQADEAVVSALAVAQRAQLEPPTVAKLLKLLAHAGLVNSQRGAGGGYRLARAAREITVADIVEAIEGPFGMTECSVHDGLCGYEHHCGVRSNWRRISAAIGEALRGVTLADMTSPPAPRAIIPVRIALS
ncbi:MAG TPA: SUF system Fe-S cluster assembly regulator [Xanthomonadaceae bacterium]|nr:SUF system Fe-S cluster assembly regulator [Xanthomonadaceae bacterium]